MAHGKGSAARNEEIISLFLLDRRLGGCTDATQEAYAYQLRPLQRWCQLRSLDLMCLDEARVRDFLADRLKVSPSTLVAAVTRIRTFYRWCSEQGHCNDPTGRIRRPKEPQELLPSFTVAQIRSMLRSCDPATFTGRRDEALIRFLVDSGARISEALGLVLDSLDLRNGRATVNGKGRRQRIVFFGAKTTRSLLRYFSGRSDIIGCSDAVFVNRDGASMNRRHAHQTIARLGKRAGIRNVRCSPHTLRHTCALLFLQRGGDAISLQRVLGHSSLAMTRRYIFQTVDDLAASHRKASPGDLL